MRVTPRYRACQLPRHTCATHITSPTVQISMQAMSSTAPVQIEGPPPVGSMKWLSQRPLWQKVSAGGILVVMIAVVAVVVLLPSGGACGCPDAYKEQISGAQSSSGSPETICHCSGDMFSCKQKCEYPLGAALQCYSNGQHTPCSKQSAQGTPSSQGGAGAPPAPTAAN